MKKVMIERPKKMRTQIVELNEGESVAFPIEKMKTIRAQTSELNCIMQRVYATRLNREDRTIVVTRKE